MNNKFISSLFLLLFISNITFSQIEGLSNWLGDWKASFTDYQINKVEENLTIKWIHSERWLQMEIAGDMPDIKLKYTSTSVLTLDNELKVIGWYIDNAGYDNMATIKGVYEDEKLIIKYDSKDCVDKITWQIKDGKLYTNGTTKMKESGKTYSVERIFTKVK